MTITFGESVTGFADTDITVVNGKVRDFSVYGAVYTAGIVPDGDGTVTVSVAAGAAQDTAGNDTAAATLSGTYDATPPASGGSGNVTAGELTSSSVRLTWAAASDAVTLAAELKYKVVYSTSANISTVSDAMSNGTAVKDWTADLSTAAATGLSASTTYYFNILVEDAVGNQAAYTMMYAKTAAVSSDNIFSGNSGNLNATVIVNGRSQTAGSSQTVTGSDGQTFTTTVDTGRLENILAAQGAGATVTVPITGGSDVAAAALTGGMMSALQRNGATLVLQTGSAGYSLPAPELNLSAIAGQFGAGVRPADLTINVSIAGPESATVRLAASAASGGGFAVVVPPVNFTVICTYNGQTVPVYSFGGYVERTVATPSGVDPTKITNGIVLDADGSVHHVPTRVAVIDGKYYAVINSLTNSTYTVIWHPVEFTDAANSWAKGSIDNLGSRMAISGVYANNY